MQEQSYFPSTFPVPASSSSSSTSSPTLPRYLLRTTSIFNPPSKLPLHLLPTSAQTPVSRFYHLRDRKLALGSQLLQRLLICRIFSPRIKSLQEVQIWKDKESGRPEYRHHRAAGGGSGILRSMAQNNQAKAGKAWLTEDEEETGDEQDFIYEPVIPPQTPAFELAPSYIPPSPSSRPKRYPTLHDYNVSHHSGLVGLAAILSPRFYNTPREPVYKRHIGIDITPMSLPPARLAAAPRNSTPTQEYLSTFTSPTSEIFTSYEAATILNPDLSDAHKIRMFYLHWALKEAYVKAIGTGLVTDLTKIEFRNVQIFDLVDDNSDNYKVGAEVGEGKKKMKRYTGTKLFLDGVERNDWYLEITSVPGVVGGPGGKENGYYIAVATEREGLSEDDMMGEWEEIDFEKDIMIWDRERN